MKEPLISVIVPVFNAEDTIEKCIESVLNQTYKNYELLLIDNSSTDNTKNIIEEYELKNERVYCYFEKNKGVSNARNIGIENCHGKYITFADADDYLEKNALEKEIKIILNYEADIIFFDYYIDYKQKIQKIDQKIEYGIYVGEKKDELLKKMCMEDYFASVWRGIYSADLIRNRVLFRETNYSEDLLFNIECIINANEIRVSDLPLYHYVDNDASSLKKLQYNLQNTIDYLDQLDCLVKENNNFDLQEVYIQSLNVCCLRILNTSIKYKEFKKWFSKIKLKNLMNNEDAMVKCINNHNYIRAFIILWKRKITNKIKRIA